MDQHEVESRGDIISDGAYPEIYAGGGRWRRGYYFNLLQRTA
jgi:hypothetical protein